MAYKNNDILNSFNKLTRKFMAFTKHQKTFVLFLFVFTAAVILLPMLSVEPTSDDTSGYHLWIWNLKLFKSFLIMLISLAWLYGRNLGIIIAIKEVRKAASQNSQKTKILNIVDDEPQQPRVENKRIVQNLFDEEDMD